VIRWPKSRYVLYLEQELERTRDELRRWQDAALIKEGLPALTPQVKAPMQKQASRPLPSQWKRHMAKWTTLTGKPSDVKN
jgi:hypothetical protein